MDVFPNEGNDIERGHERTKTEDRVALMSEDYMEIPTNITTSNHLDKHPLA